MTEQALQKVHCQVITSVGECSETLTIDGSVDDVIKILESTRTNKKNDNITVHVAPNVNINEVVEVVKSNLEKGFEKCLKTL